jgi:hypothetical protein
MSRKFHQIPCHVLSPAIPRSGTCRRRGDSGTSVQCPPGDRAIPGGSIDRCRRSRGGAVEATAFPPRKRSNGSPSPCKGVGKT